MKADNDAADEVKALITAIGEVAYSTESKAKIDAAREAYDALTAEQKALVTNYGTLTSAEGSYANLKVAKEAEDAINALPASDNIAVTDKTAVEAAQAKYDALTPAQKAIVSEASVTKLTACGNMVVAQEVIVSISDINASNPDSAKVAEARAAYDALTDEQKAKVTNYETLTAAEAKLAKTGLSGGAIAGIVIGCIFGALIIALVVLLILYKKGLIKVPAINTVVGKIDEFLTKVWNAIKAFFSKLFKKKETADSHPEQSESDVEGSQVEAQPAEDKLKCYPRLANANVGGIPIFR